MKRKWLIPIAVVAVAVVAAGIHFVINPAAWREVPAQLELGGSEGGDLKASGFIEAEEIEIAPEMGGRVVELLVDEGDEVEPGQFLLRLDGTLLEAQIEAAQAAVDVARARLVQVQAGARSQQIQQAEAGLAQAEANRDGAYQGWQDTIALRDNPQELNAQIALAEAQVAAAKAALDQAVALKDAATIAHDNYWEAHHAIDDAKDALEDVPEELRPSVPGLPLNAQLIPKDYWRAWVGVNSAGAQWDGAREALSNLYAMRNDPQELQAQVDAARAQYEAAQAAVQMAQAQLDGLRKGATEEEIAAVEAQVEQAQAALDTLLVQRDKLTITAPVGGLILERSIYEGELAAPGATLLILGDLDQVTLTIYVPEAKLGLIRVGQDVKVSVDSFPDRTFTGTLVAIANEAEFTPRNVQTEEERVNMVFAVDVRIPNPDHALKPGLPADAVIEMEEPQ